MSPDRGTPGLRSSVARRHKSPPKAVAKGPRDTGHSTLCAKEAFDQDHGMRNTDRLFSIVDLKSRRLVGLCTGPEEDGSCLTTQVGILPCEGRQVIPQHGTSIDGLPFTVVGGHSPACPLAWVDAARPRVP
jgi:hypothetical protein